MVGVFAAAFHGAKYHDASIGQAATWLEEGYGMPMKIIWGVGILAAGQSSTMTVSWDITHHETNYYYLLYLHHMMLYFYINILYIFLMTYFNISYILYLFDLCLTSAGNLFRSICYERFSEHSLAEVEACLIYKNHCDGSHDFCGMVTVINILLTSLNCILT